MHSNQFSPGACVVFKASQNTHGDFIILPTQAKSALFEIGRRTLIPRFTLVHLSEFLHFSFGLFSRYLEALLTTNPGTDRICLVPNLCSLIV